MQINILTEFINNGAFNSADFVNDRLAFGWLPVYPSVLLLGVIAVIIASVVKLRMRQIPLRDFMNSIYIIVLPGVLGASIFGKLGTQEHFDWKFWELLYFWNPGMSFFGAMLLGGFSGFLWFYKVKDRSMISIFVYIDCIIPNILLGQAIGRWGNLFNHEILGNPVTDMSQITWLPEWIWHRLFYIVDPNTGTENTTIIFRQPLFLYESLVTFTGWLLLTFIFPNICRWISKKPWKDDPESFPCKYNKFYPSIQEDKMPYWSVQAPIKYKKLNDGTVTMSLWQVWQKAYYLKEVNFKSEYKKIDYDALSENYNITLKKQNRELDKVKNSFKNNKIDKENYISNVKSIKASYRETLMTQKKDKNRIINWWKQDCTDLYKAHNPNGYKILHTGALGGIYIMYYTIARMCLEWMRQPEELTVRFSWTLDYLSFSCVLVCGIALFVFSQFISPYKFRREEWLYEKSY